jgi:hypothetical protein
MAFRNIFSSPLVTQFVEILKSSLRFIHRIFFPVIDFSLHNKFLGNIGRKFKYFFPPRIKTAEKCDYYPVERGIKLLLIFNYNNITGMDERSGSHQDVERLKCDFQSIDFEVKDYTDLTKEDTEEKLEKYRLCPDMGKVSVLFMIFMSHGSGKDAESFMSSDAKIISMEHVKMCFNDLNCPLLAGKPKVMIAVCCRAIEVKGSICSSTEHGYKNDGGDAVTPTENDGIREALNTQRRWAVDGKPIPCLSTMSDERDCNDIMTIYSCAREKISYRHEKNGSLFVQAFCKIIRENFESYDMYRIFCETQREMKKNIPHDATPLAGFEASMNPLTFKKLCLV